MAFNVEKPHSNFLSVKTEVLTTPEIKQTLGSDPILVPEGPGTIALVDDINYKVHSALANTAIIGEGINPNYASISESIQAFRTGDFFIYGFVRYNGANTSGTDNQVIIGSSYGGPGLNFWAGTLRLGHSGIDVGVNSGLTYPTQYLTFVAVRRQGLNVTFWRGEESSTVVTGSITDYTGVINTLCGSSFEPVYALNGETARVGVMNYAPSDEEVEVLRRNLGIPSIENQNGSTTTEADSTWTQDFGVNLTTNTSTSVTANINPNGRFHQNANKIYPAGQKWKVSFTTSASNSPRQFSIWINTIGVDGSVESIGTGAGNREYILTQLSAGLPIFDFNHNGVESGLTYTNISIIPLGSVFLLPDANLGSGLHLYNKNGILNVSLPSDGIYRAFPLGAVEVVGLVTAGNASMGNWSEFNSYARFGHKDFNTTNSFGFLQDNSGATYVESPLDSQINLRLDATSKLTVGRYLTENFTDFHSQGTIRGYASDGSGAVGGIWSIAQSPQFVLQETDAEVNEKHWRFQVASGGLEVDMVNDGWSQETLAMKFFRSGMTFQGAAIYGDTNSTSKDTGALVIDNGGLGVEKDVFIGGQLKVLSADGIYGPASGGIWAESQYPQVVWKKTDADVDEKIWRMNVTNDGLGMFLVNDGWNSELPLVKFYRAGVSPSLAEYFCPLQSSNARVGAWSVNTVFARFGHYSFDTGNNFGVLQDNTGAIYIEGPTISMRGSDGANRVAVSDTQTVVSNTLNSASGRCIGTAIVTANATVTTSNHLIICNSSTPITITLIAASSNSARQFIIKNKGAGTVTLDATSLGLIDGLNTATILQYSSLTVVSDGATWNII